jgi:FtsZ-binding cell division protein ZapB
MKIDEVKERLNQVVDEYKTADEKQRGELEKERKKVR